MALCELAACLARGIRLKTPRGVEHSRGRGTITLIESLADKPLHHAEPEASCPNVGRKQREVLHDPPTVRRPAAAAHRPHLLPHRRGVVVPHLFTEPDVAEGDQRSVALD